MKGTFSTAEEYVGDAYVADYTNGSQGKYGVEIRGIPFDDIDSFHLSNPRNISYWAVNFEKHLNFFDGVKQCECMFKASKSKGKPWVCLIETKYCLDKERNLSDNTTYATDQLLSTLAKLVEKDIVDLSKSKIYLNISIPEHTHKEPFTAFMSSQEDIISFLKDKNKKVRLLGYNNLLILNEAYIQVPKE